MASIINSIKAFPKKLNNIWENSPALQTTALASTLHISGVNLLPEHTLNLLPQGLINLSKNYSLYLKNHPFSDAAVRLAATILGTGLAVNSQKKMPENDSGYLTRFAKTIGYIGSSYLIPALPIAYSLAGKAAEGESLISRAIRGIGRSCQNLGQNLGLKAAMLAVPVAVLAGIYPASQIVQTYGKEALSIILANGVGIWAFLPVLKKEPELAAGAFASLIALGAAAPVELGCVTALVGTVKAGQELAARCFALKAQAQEPEVAGDVQEPELVPEELFHY